MMCFFVTGREMSDAALGAGRAVAILVDLLNESYAW